MKKKLLDKLSSRPCEDEDIFIIVFMHIPIFRFSRSKRVRSCKENPKTAPDFGYCAAQNQAYFRYKLYGIFTVKGAITSFGISAVNVDDIEYFKDLRTLYRDCLLLGNNAYLSDPLQLELFKENGLLLKTRMPANQKNYCKQPTIFRKVRKRIGTVFYQLCDQFRIQKNYAKIFRGFAAPILAKITGFTLIQYMNKFTFDKQLNYIKYTLI